MKELTGILLIIIAVIGIISIIIVKLYYRDKEKDVEKERLEEFINSTKADYDDEKRKRARKANRNQANYSEAQNYANTIDSSYRSRRSTGDEVDNAGGTTALLRQRAKAMEEAPKRQVRRVRKPQGEAAQRQAPRKTVQRTPQRVQTQMNKEEEVKPFQEPIKPEHTATINSAKQKEAQPKPRQVPMTEKQKEFIAKDANKLVVDDANADVKVVKSVLPSETIEELKESAKIEEKEDIAEADATAKAEETAVKSEEAAVKADESAKAEETAEIEEKEDIVKKAEEDTAKLIQKIEEAKSGVERTLTETEELEMNTAKVKETKVEKEGEVTEAEETKVEEEVKETPDIESTIEKIKQASKEKEEEKPSFIEGSSKVSEQITQVQEEVSPNVEEKEDEEDAIIPTPEEAEAESEMGERAYNDDLHILLNKDEKVEVDETPENEFITINAEDEVSSTGNDLINSAIKSIRNFRKANAPEKPVVEELKDDIVPEDYAQDLGDGIEYIGDTITITPIHEEEERDLANNQPNEDVDKIYKEINKKPYNRTDDEELSESFEDVSDESSEKDANVYTKEDYKKVEAKEKEKKRRVENTRRILGSKGISEDELRKKAEAKAKSKRTRKTTVAQKEPVEDGQKRLMMHKARTDVEEVYINGTLFELKVGQVVIFDINGESYSSQILRLKPGYIGVRYRSKKIWVKSNTVKKILK